MSIEQRIMKQTIAKSGKDVTVEYTETEKNNGVVLKGYRIKEVGSTLAPVIYYEEGWTEDEIVERTVKAYCDALKEGVPDLNLEKIFTKEYVLEHVWPCIVNMETNAEMLKDALHTHYLADLAIIYKVEVDIYDSGNLDGAITLRNNHLKHLDLTLADIHNTAIENVQGKGRINHLSDIVKATQPDIEVPDSPLLMISNEKMWYDTSVIFDEAIMDVLKRLGEVYIIPSSINELLVAPVCDGEEEKFLIDLIKMTNREHLTSEEFLSDNLFKFNGITFEKVEVE